MGFISNSANQILKFVVVLVFVQFKRYFWDLELNLLDFDMNVML